jgi:hypothetical protein
MASPAHLAAHTGTVINVTELRLQYRERVAQYPNVTDDYRAQWSALCRTLLAHGGALVVPPPEPDIYLDALLTGDTFTERRVPAPGWAGSSCANSADLWIFGVAHTIATGYALGDDGLWHQHTWALTGDGPDRAILETTTSREQYFGIALTGADALAFARASDPDTLEEVLATGYTLRTLHLWSVLEPTAQPAEAVVPPLAPAGEAMRGRPTGHHAAH